MREYQIEQYLKKKVSQIGGKAFKFISPGKVGVPDRMVLLPQGRIVFVELKAPGEKIRPLQAHIINTIKALGFKVEIIDSKNGVDEFIRSVNNAV